jgi:hypothetical protein
MGSGHAGLVCHVPKAEIALIQEQFIGLVIGSQIHVRQAVVVDISNGYASAVVIIAILEYVEIRFVNQFVFKFQMGVVLGEQGKEIIDGNGGRLLTAGEEK